MKESNEFRRYLKRRGKKNHVVEDLARRCNVFEEFLHKKQKSSINDATKEDVQAFYDVIKAEKTGVSNYLRAISLYYKFKSRSELSRLASDLREQRISSTRKPFKLKKFRGVNKEHITLLEKEGIIDVNQMLEKGKTPHDRRELSKKTGIPLESIREYTKLSDLSRLGAIKSVRARLYFDAGIDTPDKMASWDPEELCKMLVSYVKRSGFDGIAPLPKELKNAVETARRIKRIIEYDE
jgi:predicted DNA-binding protein YlxM (UPF0122 family)